MAMYNHLKHVRSATSKGEKARLIRESRDYSFLFADDHTEDDDVKEESVPVRAIPIKKTNPCSRIVKKPLELIESKANANLRLGTNTKRVMTNPCSRSMNKPLESIERKTNVNLRLGTNTKRVMTNPCSRSMNKPMESIKRKVNYDHGVTTKKDVIITKPLDKQCSDRKQIMTKKRRVMKRYDDSEEDEENLNKAIGIIRKLFDYDPTKYKDDRDDLKMEASFEDIQREERRSARLASKEDAEELKRLMGQENKKKKIKN